MLAWLVVFAPAGAQELPNVEPLELQGDLAMEMVAGIDRFLAIQTKASLEGSDPYWSRDLSSAKAYEKSVESNRRRLHEILGVVDERVPYEGLVLDATITRPSLVASTDSYTVHAVRWPALPGVHGEGLLLEPKQTARANVIALPDADWSPEMLTGLAPGIPATSQFARRLAEAGCRVLVPVLIDRQDAWSGLAGFRHTNQPHREFIYRMAYEMGRHIIGYEIQKVLAAVDWLSRKKPGVKIGVAGYGEGGLLALHAAASDTRIDAALVSGYLSPREQLWQEPIYRNVWALLEEFGRDGVGWLIAPRALIIEAAAVPPVSGPPPGSEQRQGGALGFLRTPTLAEVRAEVDRLDGTYTALGAKDRLQLVPSGDGTGAPGTERALTAFLEALGNRNPSLPRELLPERGAMPDPAPRMKRQFDELVEFTQSLVRQSEFTRREFWSKADASSVETWRKSTQWYRDYFWEEVIGRFPDPSEPLRPRARRVFDEPKWIGYEVVLPVWPDVFAEGILLVPKDLTSGERRPVVVCQHGLEGRPRDVVDPKIDSRYYHSYGAKLADRGFVVFAPQNPYIGQDKFRVLQRKANPLKKSLFSVIIGQHQRILQWLKSLPFVDADRIGFYGLSYGGKTAVRVPPLLGDYALSICSADFNEWIWKNTSSIHQYSYLFGGEYEMVEFNLGNTFNYSELANMMAPRPFMVERGHHDGVAPDEWVAYEYAKVRRHYTLLGLGDRTEIEFFDGPHTIHGERTFEFLHRHLNRPRP